MTAEVFIDTNIFLYAASSSDDDAPKTLIAQRLILAPGAGISTQVQQEFISNALANAPWA